MDLSPDNLGDATDAIGKNADKIINLLKLESAIKKHNQSLQEIDIALSSIIECYIRISLTRGTEPEEFSNANSQIVKIYQHIFKKEFNEVDG